jgi:hypothetical protein
VSIDTIFGIPRRNQMTPNRIVALLTPLVFAPLAGAIATWAADNLPGVQVPQSALQEVFIAGALIALAPAAQWLHGWQKWEQREADAAVAAEAADVAELEHFDMPEPSFDDEDFDDPLLLEDEDLILAGR